MQETQVQLLGQEDPLEKEMETHSSILAWKIHGDEKVTGRRPGVSKWKKWAASVRHFLSLSLKRQEKTNSKCQIFFSLSLYKFNRRFFS